MAVITFMSDFGREDHYIAAVKGAILRQNPSINIVDISHEVKVGDIGQAAYLLKNVFREFPKGTVHLCAVDRMAKEPSRQLALKVEDHFFVGPDSGVFSLISQERPMAIVDINIVRPIMSTFMSKDLLAPVAANLASGKNIHEMGKPVDSVYELFARKLKVTKREIAGNVIRVDHYGNLITNIEKKEYETIQKINGNVAFDITIGRESVGTIHKHYADVDSGECFVFFNSLGHLQIGINKGNAAELLGLKLDTPITINFHV
ncbi:S-adenosyl-l-methionine hydroxide adenosyltransferase family protein [Marinoscillum sp. MHG1-6]|uniref:SAM hydrolase/SAM-dependent halogenase family protein n=1 Tax=Marinoscillum sp. MHG1-6 TaxID=2959627 RepID=UPI00215782CF|nr:SAM-dependent chlorinase/fluorinase [Marinoscillum sp. MHG1-6]